MHCVVYTILYAHFSTYHFILNLYVILFQKLNFCGLYLVDNIIYSFIEHSKLLRLLVY